MIEVQLKDGIVTLVRPTAGVRNEAVMKADSPEGLRQTVMLFHLLPKCITKHPWASKPLKIALDELEIEEYDKLIEALGRLLKPEESDEEKKSEQPSGQSTTEDSSAGSSESQTSSQGG